jgi:hypothetical protein
VETTLPPLTAQDAEVMAGWAADPAFCREAGWTVSLPLGEYQRFHRTLIEPPPVEMLRLGAIHEGQLIGYVDLHGDEPHRRALGPAEQSAFYRRFGITAEDWAAGSML